MQLYITRAIFLSFGLLLLLLLVLQNNSVKGSRCVQSVGSAAVPHGQLHQQQRLAVVRTVACA
jgi:hypothetical protein